MAQIIGLDRLGGDDDLLRGRRSDHGDGGGGGRSGGRLGALPQPAGAQKQNDAQQADDEADISLTHDSIPFSTGGGCYDNHII